MYVVLTPLIALAVFRTPDRRAAPGSASRSRPPGSRCSPASTAARSRGDLLVLAGAAVYSLQIVLMERYAPRYDALGVHARRDAGRVRGLLAIARRARPSSTVPHGWTVWGALLVTGVFASALAFLVADVGAAAHDRDADRARLHARAGVGGALRLHARRRPARRRSAGLGCAVIMAGIVLAEPAAADTLARLVRRPA